MFMTYRGSVGGGQSKRGRDEVGERGQGERGRVMKTVEGKHG